jgi:N-acetyl sugar amidotransferase
MPDTKPDLQLDEGGVCSACRNFKNRETVNWDVRKTELQEILNKYRARDGSSWDCVIPVSGGKDSTYQTIRALELGLNPLCVTATTCDLSEIGRRNIENLKRLGVDYLEITPNLDVRRKLNRIGLKKVGDISWPEHVAIFTIPVRTAVQFNIPLILWGENPQNEYGGPTVAAASHVLDRRWLEEFGGLLGLRVTDLVGTEGINSKQLTLYTYPSDAELKRVGVTGLFLGHYFPWDGYANAVIAQVNGFSTWPAAVEGSLVNYENLDNYQTGIHDYFKFLKFGFGRATDLACLHVRRGRLSRADALELVRKRDGQFPWTYLGKKLEDILQPLGIAIDEFILICDQFTNKKLFRVDAGGKLIKDHRGSLTKLNYDNVEN